MFERFIDSMVVHTILHIDLQVSEIACYTEYGTAESCANAPWAYQAVSTIIILRTGLVSYVGAY
jgi:hypothetical protein